MPRLLFENILYNKVVKKYGNGEAVRDWLYVEDATFGILAALEDILRSSRFTISELVLVRTLNDLIQMVEEITGEKLKLNYENVPLGDAIFAGVCDNLKAKKFLGWEPKIELRTGLKDNVRVYEKERR